MSGHSVATSYANKIKIIKEILIQCKIPELEDQQLVVGEYKRSSSQQPLARKIGKVAGSAAAGMAKLDF